DEGRHRRHPHALGLRDAGLLFAEVDHLHRVAPGVERLDELLLGRYTDGAARMEEHTLAHGYLLLGLLCIDSMHNGEYAGVLRASRCIDTIQSAHVSRALSARAPRRAAPPVGGRYRRAAPPAAYPRAGPPVPGA